MTRSSDRAPDHVPFLLRATAPLGWPLIIIAGLAGVVVVAARAGDLSAAQLDYAMASGVAWGVGVGLGFWCGVRATLSVLQGLVAVIDRLLARVDAMGFLPERKAPAPLTRRWPRLAVSGSLYTFSCLTAVSTLLWSVAVIHVIGGLGADAWLVPTALVLTAVAALALVFLAAPVIVAWCMLGVLASMPTVYRLAFRLSRLLSPDRYSLTHARSRIIQVDTLLHYAI